jgi:hypothetical protein
MLVVLVSLKGEMTLTFQGIFIVFLPVCSDGAEYLPVIIETILFPHMPVIPRLSTNSSDCGIVELTMLTGRVGTSYRGTERSVCGLLNGVMCP